MLLYTILHSPPVFKSSDRSITEYTIGWGQYAIRNGSRQDAANTYLEPASNWDNLDVLINTQAIKVLHTGEEDGVPVINGVQFAQNSSSEHCVDCKTRGLVLISMKVLSMRSMRPRRSSYLVRQYGCMENERWSNLVHDT